MRSLHLEEINPEQDTFLGETSVQIKSFHDDYPSIHRVKSYLIRDLENQDDVNHLYHIFEYGCGTSAVNYNPRQYEQVKKCIDLSDHWTIFYKDLDSEDLIPVSKRWRYEEA